MDEGADDIFRCLVMCSSAGKVLVIVVMVMIELRAILTIFGAAYIFILAAEFNKEQGKSHRRS